jgi:hypothetical protein
MRDVITRGAFVALMFALTLTLGYALAHPYAPHVRHATVRCDAWAEDSAAHVRLTHYAPHGTLRYVCKRAGY